MADDDIMSALLAKKPYQRREMILASLGMNPSADQIRRTIELEDARQK